MGNPFQSTLPARGATCCLVNRYAVVRNFNPRSPHGERLCGKWRRKKENQFQSTLPARGATPSIIIIDISEDAFQSTLPARGATKQGHTVTSKIGFQSTLPARGATASCTKRTATAKFQSTLPARGATHPRWHSAARMHFNPRSPHGERRPP